MSGTGSNFTLHLFVRWRLWNLLSCQCTHSEKQRGDQSFKVSHAIQWFVTDKMDGSGCLFRRFVEPIAGRQIYRFQRKVVG